MQTIAELNEQFALPGLLQFDEPSPGMPRARVATACCTAALYLQGAHLAEWTPVGQQPVLFLSGRSGFTPGKAIRGGIPVIFPWFGDPKISPVHPPPGSPAHGYARVWPWTLRFAALAGEDLHLSLTLDHNERLHAIGFDFLQLGLELVLGRSLTVRLTAANSGKEAFLFEEALHTYLAVANIDQVTIEGLAGTEYLDKTDDFRRKTQEAEPLRFRSEVDRPYLNTGATVMLCDSEMGRRLEVSKQNSASTVVWNPAAEVASRLPDLEPADWERFACVETANVAENAIRLQPGEAHTMTMRLAVAPL